MNIFELRQHITSEYKNYANGFINIADARIEKAVEAAFSNDAFIPEPLIQLNPNFKSGGTIEELIKGGMLHRQCEPIFRRDKDKGMGTPLRLHAHQRKAIELANAGHSYILTTGTGSGKSLAYIIPIVDYILKNPRHLGIKAIVVYPMNALANSQKEELRKYLEAGFQEKPVTFDSYTGQDDETARQNILKNPPDILLTNFMMLELLMTRHHDRELLSWAENLRFLVFDELHTYRGRQGADVSLLIRRVRHRLNPNGIMQCIGTSATLATEGTVQQQTQIIADFATKIFGTVIDPAHVIREQLQRVTPQLDFSQPDIQDELKRAIEQSPTPPEQYDDFINHPLSSWIESEFGIAETPDGHLIRQKPSPILGKQGKAKRLAELTGITEIDCQTYIQQWLMVGYNQTNPETGLRAFAFRLHQFISPFDTIYASLEAEDIRKISLDGQLYYRDPHHPDERKIAMYPLCFCRHCGQEYYLVRRIVEGDQTRFIPRDIGDTDSDKGSTAGFLYLSTSKPWGDDMLNDNLPDDWFETSKANSYQDQIFDVPMQRKLKPDYTTGKRGKIGKYYGRVPRNTTVSVEGVVSDTGQLVAFFVAPFQFCISCQVAYDSTQRSEFAKVSLLSYEGRSSATTILSLSAVKWLRLQNDLGQHAKKLLSFTDNRQDASLQAGHFNDFVELGLLRAAIYRAIHDSPSSKLRYEEIALQVLDKLGLDLSDYAKDPDIRGYGLEQVRNAMIMALEYRIYRDLKRGWRLNFPNLEKCGLLKIDYLNLQQTCEESEIWQHANSYLQNFTPDERLKLAMIVLDFMRFELAIDTDVLDKTRQRILMKESDQHLIEPWAIDSDENLEYAKWIFVGRQGDEREEGRYLTSRGLVGKRIKEFIMQKKQGNPTIKNPTSHDVEAIIRDLLEALRRGYIVHQEKHGGYKIKSSAIIWQLGDGTPAPERLHYKAQSSQANGNVNTFFQAFYKTTAETFNRLHSHEHTAQVPYHLREEREQAFREGKLPILYCSPTMELGIDISELNVVIMRNVPPAPANYAQRSGRAGRSGTPALVITYCARGNSHDQYFFKRMSDMVSGEVKAPRIDLHNRDLHKTHIHAIWLAELDIDLGKSLADTVLDILDPPLRLQPVIVEAMQNLRYRQRAEHNAIAVLSQIDGLTDIEVFVQQTLKEAFQNFNKACDRWRNLYQAALDQFDEQHKIRRDPMRSNKDHQVAKNLEEQAENQLHLLKATDNVFQSDFYSYRYFATEGFLPGYSFTRLPISAYIPARKAIPKTDTYLSRPRFIAVSEFGPKAIIYHEGAKYMINRVLMPVGTSEENAHYLGQAQSCDNCGYVYQGVQHDLCERCQASLRNTIHNMMMMQNVETVKRFRISSEEEDRFRQGFEILTRYHFNSTPQTTRAQTDNAVLFDLTYASTATIWRINLGKARRKNKNEKGFVLDLERGYWLKESDADDQTDGDDGLKSESSGYKKRVVPYVSETKNCLLLQPTEQLDNATMATLQAALKRAIQAEYQLEDTELQCVALPDDDHRRILLFYEVIEGGAGVLNQLIDDQQALRKVAQTALYLCHLDDAGQDRTDNMTEIEPCVIACYDCLMNYSNQRDHRMLDRHLIKDFLMKMMHVTIQVSPTAQPRDAHYHHLLEQCESDLERKWLKRVYEGNYRLPSHAQYYYPGCQTRLDFFYKDHNAAIYIDGSHHDQPHRQIRDKMQRDCLEDEGITVISFGYMDQWDAILKRYKDIFGGSYV